MGNFADDTPYDGDQLESDVEDYEVGYRKPPKSTQFKKGQSGNPKGRGKGNKNIASVVNEVFLQKVRVLGENGRPYSMPSLEAMVTQLRNQALKGDLKAIRVCFDIVRMFPHIMEPPPVAPPVFHITFPSQEEVDAMHEQNVQHHKKPTQGECLKRRSENEQSRRGLTDC